MDGEIEMQITIAQFEEIDELFNQCLRRSDLEAVMAHPYATADYVRSVYFRPQWKLESACIEAAGYRYVNEFDSVVGCAAQILTDAMLGTIEVRDVA